MLCLQFRSQRSSAWCVLLERCVMVSGLTLLYTHMLAWQQGTRSWSLMEPVCVKLPCLCCSMFFCIVKSRYQWLYSRIFLCLQPFGLICIQLACYHGARVLTTSVSAQKHTFLEQLRPSVGITNIQHLNVFKYSNTLFSFSLLFYFDILIQKPETIVNLVYFISGTNILKIFNC